MLYYNIEFDWDSNKAERIRLISARKANRREQEQYYGRR